MSSGFLFVLGTRLFTPNFMLSFRRAVVILKILPEILKQWFVTEVPRNPRAPPTQCRDSARSYKNVSIDSLS